MQRSTLWHVDAAGAAAGGEQDTGGGGGGEREEGKVSGGISLAVFVSQVQEMKNENERGEEEEECKEHLSLKAAVAAITDGKLIIYLCKFVILGRGWNKGERRRAFEYVAHMHAHTRRMSKVSITAECPDGESESQLISGFTWSLFHLELVHESKMK